MLTFRPGPMEALVHHGLRTIVPLAVGSIALGWHALASFVGLVLMDIVVSVLLNRVVVTPAGIRITTLRWWHRTYPAAHIRRVYAPQGRSKVGVMIELSGGGRRQVPFYVPADAVTRIHDMLASRTGGPRRPGPQPKWAPVR
jgi:hypothetical protein